MDKEIIIFAGADKSGKTTLAKMLAEKLNIDYYKKNKQCGLFHDNIASYHSLMYDNDILLDIIKQKKTGIILDRSFICEYSYSKTYNRHTNFIKIKELDEQFYKLNAKIIFCYNSNYKFNFTDECVNVNDVDSINNHYLYYLQYETNMKNFILDISKNSIEENLIQIIKFIKNEDTKN